MTEYFCMSCQNKQYTSNHKPDGKPCVYCGSILLIKTEPEQDTLLTSECLVVGFDNGNPIDKPTLVVGRHNGKSMKVIKTIFGEEAEDLYQKLTNINNINNASLERRNENE